MITITASPVLVASFILSSSAAATITDARAMLVARLQGVSLNAWGKRELDQGFRFKSPFNEAA